MAHPFEAHRQTKVEHSRVGSITKGYASGGGVHSDASSDKALIKKTVKPSALRADGGAVKARMDRPARASGGRVKKGATTVNVIVAPQGGQNKPDVGPVPGVGGPPPGPPPVPMPPPRPMPGPMAGPPGLPPGGPGGPPPMIRSVGGRAYASGGRVFEEGCRNGTQVQHSPGKNDGKNIGRGKPITYKTGGPINAKPTGQHGPKFGGGARGGDARLQKARRAAKIYAKA